MKVKELIERLQNKEFYNPNDEICAHLWVTEDVFSRIKDREMDLKITKKQANDIIDAMESNIDCEYGVTWNTIDYYLDEYERINKHTGRK